MPSLEEATGAHDPRGVPAAAHVDPESLLVNSIPSLLPSAAGEHATTSFAPSLEDAIALQYPGALLAAHVDPESAMIYISSASAESGTRCVRVFKSAADSGSPVLPLTRVQVIPALALTKIPPGLPVVPICAAITLRPSLEVASEGGTPALSLALPPRSTVQTQT